MKKWISLSVLCICTQLLYAQVNKGDWLVGGALSLNTAENNTTFELSPNAGYFLFDNFMIGARLSYSYNQLGTVKSSTFGIGPFTRYYFQSGKVKPFGEFDLDFESTKLTAASVSSTESAVGFFVGGGVALFISDNVALETIMGYKNTKVENESGKGGFNMRIGFQVYINRVGKLARK